MGVGVADSHPAGDRVAPQLGGRDEVWFLAVAGLSFLQIFTQGGGKASLAGGFGIMFGRFRHLIDVNQSGVS